MLCLTLIYNVLTLCIATQSSTLCSPSCLLWALYCVWHSLYSVLYISGCLCSGSSLIHFPNKAAGAPGSPFLTPSISSCSAQCREKSNSHLPTEGAIEGWRRKRRGAGGGGGVPRKADLQLNLQPFCVWSLIWGADSKQGWLETAGPTFFYFCRWRSASVRVREGKRNIFLSLIRPFDFLS